MSKFSPHQHLSQTFCIYKRRRYTYLNCLGKNGGLNVLRCIARRFTSKSLEPLLPSSPSQHQQPDEDHDDAHQHAGDCDHHLHAFTTARVVLAHIGSLHQRCNSAWMQGMTRVSCSSKKMTPLAQRGQSLALRKRACDFK